MYTTQDDSIHHNHNIGVAAGPAGCNTNLQITAMLCIMHDTQIISGTVTVIRLMFALCVWSFICKHAFDPSVNLADLSQEVLP